MNDSDLLAQWKLEEAKPFSGWDFSHLKDRYFESEPHWSYDAIARELMRGADTVLDMGTGGGEKLLEFKDALPKKTTATEGYRPNLEIARQNLRPHGIDVVHYNIDVEDQMPFSANSFALILNRHEAFDAFEVERILKPGGVFLTQQVDGRSQDELASVFGGSTPYPYVHLSVCGAELSRAGLVIERSEEAMGTMRFTDVGALVYYAHAAPWDFPEDFSVERYADQLLELHRAQRLTFPMGHFLVQARKPV